VFIVTLFIVVWIYLSQFCLFRIQFTSVLLYRTFLILSISFDVFIWEKFNWVGNFYFRTYYFRARIVTGFWFDKRPSDYMSVPLKSEGRLLFKSFSRQKMHCYTNSVF
jgi:hypothetical protein